MGVLSDGKKKIKISMLKEEETIENNVAQYPVQRGQPIVDHTQRQSKTWEMEGQLQGKNQKAIDALYTQLLNWQYAGTLLTWTGAIRHPSILIAKLNKSYSDGGFVNALPITLSLTAVTLVKTPAGAKKSKGPKKPAKKKSAKKKGTYVTVKSGNTYWGWSQRYGTSIATLRKWNGWPDRRIPIGKKARVK